MPNPFPGMDPFLEEPALWPSVHNRLVPYLADVLNRKMPSGYIATIEERVFLVEPPSARYPDVFVATNPRKRSRVVPGTAAVAVLEADPALEIEFPPTEYRESFVEIHLGRKPGSLVAVLEVLSPSNKNPGNGRDLYLEKQSELLGSKTHLIEIDLLRAGQHTVAIPGDGVEEPEWDYLVCLHKGGWRNKFHVWPVPLAKRLPRFAVPLAGQDADVVVDLQELLNQCYDAGRFEDRLDYRAECPPPLSRKNAKWADDHLRKKKLRK